MNPTIPVPRPVKRVRVIDGADSVVPLGKSPSPSSLQVPPVKRERTPSPPLKRRLVTSGTKRFAPLPADCLPSCPGYRRNRAHWAAQHVKELQSLNLILERKMIRDDGLVIDWKSVVPVWSDSLKPEVLDLAATITLAHQRNALLPLPRVCRDCPPSVTGTPTPERSTSSAPNSAQPAKKKLPVPPRPSLMRRMIPARSTPSSAVDLRPSEVRPSSPSPKRRRSLDETDVASCPPCRQSPDSASRPPAIADSVPTEPLDSSSVIPLGPRGEACNQLIPPWSSAAEEEMSEMTLDFLRRYIQTYEADRASLASAYASNASFSYRVHKIGHDSNKSPVPLTSPCSAPKRTRLDIMTALLALPPLHSTPGSTLAQFLYDIFYLGEALGMFVVCRWVISGKTVVHSLILQKKEADAEDAAIEGVWPLVATAHQILVFES